MLDIITDDNILQYGEIDHDWQYLAVKSEKQGLSMWNQKEKNSSL